MEKRLDYSSFRESIYSKEVSKTGIYTLEKKREEYEIEEKRYQLAKKVINEHREEFIEEPFERLTSMFIKDMFNKHVEVSVNVPKNLTSEEIDSLLYTEQLRIMFLIKLLEEIYHTAFSFDIAWSEFDCNGIPTVFLYRFHITDYLL